MALRPVPFKDPIIQHFIEQHLEFQVNTEAPTRLHVTIHLEAEGESPCLTLAVESGRQVSREVVELCLVEDGEAEQPRLVVL